MLAAPAKLPLVECQSGSGEEHVCVRVAEEEAYDGSVDLVDLGRLTEEQYAELVGDEVDPWGAAGVTLSWRPKDRHVVVRDDHARLVAAALKPNGGRRSPRSPPVRLRLQILRIEEHPIHLIT